MEDSISQHTYFISGNTAINTWESLFDLFFVRVPLSPPVYRLPSVSQPNSSRTPWNSRWERMLTRAYGALHRVGPWVKELSGSTNFCQTREVTGKHCRKGRDMICFCINNNRGSRNHISPSLLHFPCPSFSLSISFPFGKVRIHSPKQATYYHMYRRSHYLCWFHLLGLAIGISISSVMAKGTVGRCIEGGLG